GHRLLGGQPQLFGRNLGHRLQQRTVEQLLMQPADPRGMPVELEQQHLASCPAPARLDASGTRQPAQLWFVVESGKQAGAEELAQLQAVLDVAQVPIVLAETPRALPA